MSASAVAGRAGVEDFAGGDRIDVTDGAGVRIGWVDPRTGVRNLLAPGRRAEFDQMIDYWLSAAGLGAADSLDQSEASAAAAEATREPATSTNASESKDVMHIREVRYPDAEVVRSLLIPLRRLP